MRPTSKLKSQQNHFWDHRSQLHSSLTLRLPATAMLLLPCSFPFACHLFQVWHKRKGNRKGARRRVFLFCLKARVSPALRACACHQHQPAFTRLMHVHLLMFGGQLQLSEDILPTLGETGEMCVWAETLHKQNQIYSFFLWKSSYNRVALSSNRGCCSHQADEHSLHHGAFQCLSHSCCCSSAPHLTTAA